MNNLVGVWKARKVIVCRAIAVALDIILASLFVFLLSKVHLPNDGKLKWILLVLFTSSATAILGLIVNRFQVFVDKHRDRHDDLVVLQRELNRSIVVIDGNVTTINKFLEDPIFNNPIVINPEKIEFDVGLTKNIQNLTLLNELEELYIDYLILNRDIQTIKQGYDRTIQCLLSGKELREGEEIQKYQKLVEGINSIFKNDIKGLVGFLKYAIGKTEYIISLIEASMQRIYPNHFKYFFWFVSDWIFTVILSYKGFLTGLRYVQDVDLKRDASLAYIRFKKSQQEVMKKSREEIDMIQAKYGDKGTQKMEREGFEPSKS